VDIHRARVREYASTRVREYARMFVGPNIRELKFSDRLGKTFILKFLRIPHTHGVFRYFSTSLRRVPRRWRGPAADRATPGGRSVSPKVLEPVHFGAKHRRRNQYFIVHILVHF
jgi:hypothetical protein